MANLVLPNALDVDTVVPQIADNQFVPDDVLSDMISNGWDYTHSMVAGRREAAVRNEFFRCLMYSSQVVVNRVALRNNPFIFSMFASNNPEKERFDDLMRKHILLPYFFREHAVDESLNFTTMNEGDMACKELADRLQGDYGYVRLASDDKVNESLTKQFSVVFSNYLTTLRSSPFEAVQGMVSELLTEEQIKNGVDEEFEKHLNILSHYAFENGGRDRYIQREQVYSNFFCRPPVSDDDKPVVNGKFRVPGELGTPQCLFALKKLVDLRYNSTLPDLLNRYTFVPAGMPTRAALGDLRVTRQQITQQSFAVFQSQLDQFRKEISQLIHANINRVLTIPLPASMQLADIIGIRDWDEWQELASARRKLVDFGLTQSKLSASQLAEDFQNYIEAFYAFHEYFSNRWTETHPNAIADGTARRVVGAVSYALRVGPYVLAFFEPTTAMATKLAIKAIPDGVASAAKSVSINLLTDFFDPTSMELDSDLSMSVELLDDNLDVTREWLELAEENAINAGGGAVTLCRDRSDKNRDISR